MSAGEYVRKASVSPMPTCICSASDSPMVSSSGLRWSAPRPAMIRARSTTRPKRSSTCAAVARNFPSSTTIVT